VSLRKFLPPFPIIISLRISILFSTHIPIIISTLIPGVIPAAIAAPRVDISP
jgi:hypothetical protein